MTKAWFDVGNGRMIWRTIPEPCETRSSLPIPYMKFDRIEPVQSQADGKMYDSLSALRKTYRADGNPQGISYQEVGNEDLTKMPTPVRDPKKAMDAIERAESDIIAGRAPKILDAL